LVFLSWQLPAVVRNDPLARPDTGGANHISSSNQSNAVVRNGSSTWLCREPNQPKNQHRQLKRQLRGADLCERASRRPSVCITIPTFNRTVGLSGRQLKVYLGLHLQYRVSRRGWRPRCGQTEDHGSVGMRPWWGGITLAGRLSGIRTQIGHV
jgi:hypothetical protein